MYGLGVDLGVDYLLKTQVIALIKENDQIIGVKAITMTAKKSITVLIKLPQKN